jgi:hypothetical protein
MQAVLNDALTRADDTSRFARPARACASFNLAVLGWPHEASGRRVQNHFGALAWLHFHAALIDARRPGMQARRSVASLAALARY